MKHVIICGQRGTGKTTLIEMLLAQYTGPLYGFRTKITHTGADGYHQIYMFPAKKQENTLTEENHIGDCNTRERIIYPEVFETLGAQLLREAKPDGILLMDELGFMESQAEGFCRSVIERFDGDIPVIAAAKAPGGIETDFLRALWSHPRAEMFMLNGDNIQDIYHRLLPWIQKQNEVYGKC